MLVKPYKPMAETYRQELVKELEAEYLARPQDKDILVVVENSLERVKTCLLRIKERTKRYRLLVYDNASNAETSLFLQEFGPHVLVRNEESVTSATAVNQLMEYVTNPYVFLVGYGCKVDDYWDLAILGWLQKHTDYGIVSYHGGTLASHGGIISNAFGDKVDYLENWCSGFARETYDEIGPFDDKLNFSLWRDVDWSIRAKKKGKKLRALHLSYAKNSPDSKAIPFNVMEDFEYIGQKWRGYLANERIEMQHKPEERLIT